MKCTSVPIQKLDCGSLLPLCGFLSTLLGINGLPNLANSSRQGDCVTVQSHEYLLSCLTVKEYLPAKNKKMHPVVMKTQYEHGFKSTVDRYVY